MREGETCVCMYKRKYSKLILDHLNHIKRQRKRWFSYSSGKCHKFSYCFCSLAQLWAFLVVNAIITDLLPDLGSLQMGHNLKIKSRHILETFWTLPWSKTSITELPEKKKFVPSVTDSIHGVANNSSRRKLLIVIPKLLNDLFRNINRIWCMK